MADLLFVLFFVAFLVLSAFDGIFTVKILEKTDIIAEQNPLIRWLAKLLPLRAAVALGVGVPSLALLYLFGTFGLTSFLAFVSGIRVPLVAGQIRVVKALYGKLF
jgi:hypothetical protein